MRFAAIVLMVGQLVGSPLSAVHAHAWTADSLGVPAAPTAVAGADSPSPSAAGHSPFPVVEVPPSDGHRHRVDAEVRYSAKDRKDRLLQEGDPSF